MGSRLSSVLDYKDSHRNEQIFTWLAHKYDKYVGNVYVHHFRLHFEASQKGIVEKYESHTDSCEA